MVHILHTLAANGYHLVACTDMSKRGPDKDTLIFRPGPAAQRWFFAVSFNEFDKIRLIDSPNDEVTRAFAAAVRVSGCVVNDLIRAVLVLALGLAVVNTIMSSSS
jgi:hypothetical protein